MDCWLRLACVVIPAAAVFSGGLIPARADGPQVVPVDGEPFSAEVAAIDDRWQICFTAEGRTIELPAANLVRWGNPRELRRGPILVFAGAAGFLPADVLAADKENLTAESALFGLVEVPLELVAGIVFQVPVDRHERDVLLDAVSSAHGSADDVLLTNGDRIAGKFEAIGNTAVRLASVVGPVEVECHRIAALIFNPSLVRRPPADGLRSLAGFADGSRLTTEKLVLSPGSLKLSLPGGLAWTTDPAELVFLQPLGGRVTYLSDLSCDGYRHVPFLSLPWSSQKDRDVTGGWLRAGDRIYAKGLGVHSASRITYALNGRYARFDALLAIDDSAAGQGSVRFRVFVDGSAKFASSTIRGGEPPVPVSLPIEGAERIDLVVDFADRAGVLDHADWLDARLVQQALR